MVIWVTGLSGAGKTTLCSAIHGIIKPYLPELVLLDGDIVRQAFGQDLGHREEDRVRQVHRLQGMAKVLAEQDLAVIVAVLYGRPDLLAWNRENLPGYFEVHLAATLETVAARDGKGLYAKAKAGRITDVVGIDIPWYPPVNPDMAIDMDHPEPPEVLAWRIILANQRLATAARHLEPAL